MAKVRHKWKKKYRVIILMLVANISFYIVAQLAITYKILPRNQTLNVLLPFGRKDPDPRLYLAFLASIFEPQSASVYKDCLWNLQNNQTFMVAFETLLTNTNQSPKHFIADLKKDIMFCVSFLPNQTTKLESFMKQPFHENEAVTRNSTIGLKSDLSEYLNFTTSMSKTSEWNAEDLYQHTPCLIERSKLTEVINIDLEATAPKMNEIEKKYPQLFVGGFFPGPKFCKPRHSTAIIIPYRDREEHLRYWLYYTLGTLITQQILFTVFVVEQEGTGVFNKGQLMNTAFVWVSTNAKVEFDCFVFQDVDMIPEVPGNIYACAEGNAVYHLSPFIDKFSYSYKNKTGITVGGAVAFKKWQYRAVNGYSNVYWGWGGEDDDMNKRIQFASLRRTRPDWLFGRYRMIRHGRDSGNPINAIRHKLLKKAVSRMSTDGLVDLNTTITKVVLLPTHTHIMVKLLNSPPLYNISTP